MNKKSIAYFELVLLVVSMFAFSFLLAEPVAAQTATSSPSACCEKLDSGGWCINAEESSCDDSYKISPTSCETTSYCRLGTCYNSESGICMGNTPQRVCDANGGTWDSREIGQVPQCQLGCCIIAEQAAYVSLTRCKRLSTLFGVENDYRTDINSEVACIIEAQSQEVGACVYEKEFERLCEFTTRGDCGAAHEIEAIGEDITNASLEVTAQKKFYTDYLCSAEELGTACAKQTSTTCFQGKVYFVDSCGNRENVYSSDGAKSWNKGRVADPDEVCAGNDGSDINCGNCEYLLGTRCASWNGFLGIGKPSGSDHYCQKTECIDRHGEKRINGESWCVKDEITGEGADRVGSRYYRELCVDGVVRVEPCADFRNEICLDNSIDTGSGTFKTGACRVNRWQDCWKIDDLFDCENSDQRDCMALLPVKGMIFGGGAEDEGAETASKFSSPASGDSQEEAFTNPTATGSVTAPITGNFLGGLLGGGDEEEEETGESPTNRPDFICVPEYPPGLEFWKEGNAQQMCGLANAKCTIVYEMGLLGKLKEKLTGENASVDKDAGAASFLGTSKKIVKGKECLEAQWVMQANQVCAALGDCGGYVNYNGVWTSDGYRWTKEDGKQAKFSPNSVNKISAGFSGMVVAAITGLSVGGLGTITGMMGGLLGEETSNLHEKLAKINLKINALYNEAAEIDYGDEKITMAMSERKRKEIEAKDQAGIDKSRDLLSQIADLEKQQKELMLRINQQGNKGGKKRGVSSVIGTTGKKIDIPTETASVEDMRTYLISKLEDSKHKDRQIKDIKGWSDKNVKEHYDLNKKLEGKETDKEEKEIKEEAEKKRKDKGNVTGKDSFLAGLLGATKGSAMSGILTGVQWGVGAYFIGKMVGPMLGFSSKNTKAFSAALGAGVGAYKFLKAYKGSGWLANLNPMWGIGIGAAVFLVMYRSESVQVVEFNCMPWQAPVGGDVCELCNDPNLPCSEYRCRSLGQNCELVNQGSAQERCVTVRREDTNPPIISPNEAMLSYGHEYADVKISPPGPGFKIINMNSSDGCLKAFTSLEFGVNTDEPAQCKIDLKHTLKFDDMAVFMGGSNFYAYNHSEMFALPGAKEMENSSFILENGKDTMFFIRCKDKNGNENSAEYAVKFCIDPTPDSTPPQVAATSVTNGGCVAAEQDVVSVEFYTNEPSNCRWSKEDRDYSLMENEMTCSGKYSYNALQLFTCSTELTGVARDETKFYIRCKDQPGKPEEDRNENKQSYVFSLRGSSELKMKNLRPNETIFGGVSPMPVELSAETLFGCNEGRSICFYATEDNDNAYIMFFDTNTDDGIHTQRLDLSDGTHEYFIKCVDEGGNVVKDSVEFSLDIDENPPAVARVYEEDSMLKIVTVRTSECAYSFIDCDFSLSEGTQMPYANSTVHVAEWNPDKTYFIKCRDEFRNEEADCSIIVRPSRSFF